MRELQAVGRTHPVHDARQKATGELAFGSDLRLPGMVFARLLLSPHAHAVVERVDGSAAMAVPGVLGVFSHGDAPRTPYCRARLTPGEPGCIEDEMLFAATARFVGDRVAAVVARTEQLASEALRLISVDYTVLPPVLTPEAALADRAVAIHAGGNVVSEYDRELGEPVGERPDAITTTTTTMTQKVHHAALETHVCMADYDRAGKLTVWTPTQGVYGVRALVGDVLGLDYSSVRVVKVPTGGSFGGKQEFILEPVAAFLAMRLRRPVRLALDREECIIATTTRPATASSMRTVVDRDGALRDVEIDTVLDAGAYAGSSPGYALLMAHKLTRLYRVPHYRHRGRVAYTTSPVAGGCRGWGAPEAVTCIELHLDQVAKRLGMDPTDLRMRNLVDPGDVDPALGMSLGDARVRECLQVGADAFGWRDRFKSPVRTGRIRRGVGVACGGHYNGLLGETPAESSTMTLKMNEDGSLDLNASLHENGCGSVTAMAVIVAEELGVVPERVSVGEADSDVTPYDVGCYASRVTYVCGAAALAVAAKLKERLLEAAATLLDAHATTLEVAGGRIRVAARPERGLSYAEIVQETRRQRGEDLIVTNTYHNRTNPGSYCVQFADVEVDVLTGLARVTNVLAVADVGRALNRGMVEAQYRGAVQMGVGYALCEDVVLDDLGRPRPGGFKDYRIVNTPDMPTVDVVLVEHEGDDGPYGAKSVGEVATVPTAAAVVNALNHALDTSISSLPVTPERVMAALSERKAASLERAASAGRGSS